MYRTFEIRQEAGPRAMKGRMFAPLPRLVGRDLATNGKEALEEYIWRTYLTTGKASYAGHRIEWRTTRNLDSAWRPDDRKDPGTRGREWSAVVTLRNGHHGNRHEVRLLAWLDPDGETWQ